MSEAVQVQGEQPNEPREAAQVPERLVYAPVRPAPAFLPLRAVLIVLLLLLFLAARLPIVAKEIPLLIEQLPVRNAAVLWVTLGLALVSLPGAYVMEQRGLLEHRLFRWIIPATDLLLILLLHVGSCGATSPFLSLFYVPITYAGLLAGYPGSMAAALGAALGYGTLYAIAPSTDRWIVLSVILLLPVAGTISGYLGRYFARLNALGQALVEQADTMYQEVEERRVLYENWYRAVDRLKADFVYSASHELRTPLTPIKGYVQFLATPDVSLSDEKRQEYWQVVANNVAMLAQLVDDIIYLQRVTRIPIDLGEVSMSEVAQQAMEEVTGASEEAQVQVHMDDWAGLPSVLGSSDSLKLVLSNLLESVIHDSPNGGVVGLALRPADGGVDVRVSGPGRGIPAELQERLFDLFFHADSSPTYVLGREGLSLAVARYIVEMHGGRISVENQPRGGMSFTVHLPGHK